MAEEFEESEVIFSDRDHNESSREIDALTQENSRVFSSSNRKGKKKKQKKSNSVPVNIPINNVFQFSSTDSEYDFEEESDGGELIPPHVILRRRIAGKMTFSVCTGNGRTLKGRDLSEVRNSILRMTGFLET